MRKEEEAGLNGALADFVKYFGLSSSEYPVELSCEPQGCEPREVTEHRFQNALPCNLNIGLKASIFFL